MQLKWQKPFDFFGLLCFLTYVLLALPGLEIGVTDASGNDIFTSWIPHIPESK